MLFISEQYHQTPPYGSWHYDSTNTAAIWVVDTTKTTVEKKGHGRGFVWVKVKQHAYVSCYFTPNESIRTYEEKLEELEDFLREVTGDAIHVK